MKRIQPQVNGLSSEVFDGCNQGLLKLQRCLNCHAVQFYPRVLCAMCSERDMVWINASGRGNVASFTIVRRALTEGYEAPYVVALIDLEEGPRMMSNIVDCSPEIVVVGAPVKVAFTAWSDTLSLPVFVLDNEK